MKVVDKDKCWLWPRGTCAKGYGVIWNGKRQELVHRIMYRDAYGEIPEGKEIDHLCETPACINPEHLEAVTHKVNLRRAMFKYRITECKRGHPFTEDNLEYFYIKTGLRCRQCKTCKYMTPAERSKFDAERLRTSSRPTGSAVRMEAKQDNGGTQHEDSK